MAHKHLGVLFLLVCVLFSAEVAAQDAAPAPPKPTDIAEHEAAREQEIPKRSGVLQVVRLTDGTTLRGYVTRRGDLFEVKLTSGSIITVPRESVLSIHDADLTRETSSAQTTAEAEIEEERDTHRTRYLYSPSGMMLKKGEGYISVKELIFTSMGYGVTDNISIVVGGAMPLWLVTVPNIIGGVKVGGSVNDWLHLSAGGEVFGMPGYFSGSFIDFGGLVFGNVTLGNPRANITLNAGYPFSPNGIETQIFITSLSGYYEFNNLIGVVTENWLLPSTNFDYAIMFNSIAARLTPRDFALDLGLIYFSELDREYGAYTFPLPLPWIDFSWSFGG